MVDIKIEKSVTVITPTISGPHVRKAVQSVDQQTYKNLRHLVVCDGPGLDFKVFNNISGIPPESSQWSGTFPQFNKLQMVSTPDNTGQGYAGLKQSFYGHRIYAGYAHLINSDYIAFLDEDNWYEPNHISSLVDAIEKNNWDWAYSLRNICTPNGDFLDEDNCESLGRWPVYWSLDRPQKEHLVDTSTYIFKREFLIQVSNIWHWGWGGDRRFYNTLVYNMHHDNYGTTGLHTMNYRLDDQMEKKYGSERFFIDGNDIVLKHYNGKYPWRS